MRVFGDGVRSGADPFDAAALDAARRRVDNWQADLAEQASRARELADRVRRLTATATSADGMVRVTVASSGVPTELWLDEAVRRRSAARTAEQILAVTRAAVAGLAERVAEAAEETVGAESPIGRAMVESFARRARELTESSREP